MVKPAFSPAVRPMAAARRSWPAQRPPGQPAASRPGSGQPGLRAALCRPDRMVATTGHRFPSGSACGTLTCSPSGSTYGTFSRAEIRTWDVVQTRTQTITVKPKSLPLNAVVPLYLATKNSSARILTR